MTVSRLAILAAACALATACADRSPARNSMTSSAGIAAPQYAEQAAGSDLFEIQSSQLALERSSNPAVRGFAQQMISDHSRSAAQLQSAAAQRSAAAPALDPRHAQMLTQLRGLSGAQFDAAYMQMQVQGHREALGLQQAYGSRGSDPQLRQLATQATPMIQHHLSEAESISGNIAAAPAVPPATGTVTPLR